MMGLTEGWNKEIKHQAEVLMRIHRHNGKLDLGKEIYPVLIQAIRETWTMRHLVDAVQAIIDAQADFRPELQLTNGHARG